MDIKELKNLQCNREVCIKLVKEISKKYKKEHYHILGVSVANSVNRYISVICYSSDYLDGFCIICDEINPIKLSSYLFSILEADVDEEILLLYVAYILKKRINEFYRELKNGTISMGVPFLKSGKGTSEYKRKCKQRMNLQLKLIRS